MTLRVQTPRRGGIAVCGLALLVVSAVTAATAQGPAGPSPPPLPDCATVAARHFDMQMNLRASAALVACGREVAGGEAAELGIARESGTGLAGSNVNSISGAESNPHVTQSEHQIWSEGSTVVINYNDSRDAGGPTVNLSGVSYSTDGGKSYTRILPSPFATGHETNYGDPTVVFNKNLHAWYAGDLATGCGGFGIGLWTSANGSLWTAGACAHSSTDDDRPSMTVDNNPSSPYYGRMYLSWNNFELNDANIQASYSTNGTTWSTPLNVSTVADFRRNVELTVAPNGNVLLVAMNEGGGGPANRSNVLYRSTDGGVTFSTEISMGSAFAPPCDFDDGYFRVCNPIWRHMGWGDVATGANNAAIYVYAAAGAGGDTGDIYHVRSTDNGVTWAAPVRADGASQNRTQWMPSIGGGGKYFMMSWYDRKNTAGNDYERYGVISKDGGQTWSAPQRISDMIIPQPTQPDPNVQSNYAGDYMRTFFDGTTFYDGWTDGRIVVSGAGNQQDVETQRVRLVSPADFNGDVKTDRTVFRPGNSVWYTSFVGGGATSTGWGTSGDIDVAADYDGDGTTDIAIFRPSTGQWYILQSSNGAVRMEYWGASGDVPVPGDVDGDGKADLGIFRASAGTWYIKKSSGAPLITSWGTTGDVPMLADYDNDGKADVTIYRPGTGIWYILRSTAGSIAVAWGAAGDVPVVGDYDGDGRTDVGIFRPSSGAWVIIRSSNGTSMVATWGVSGDIPVSGDQDGDGISDFIVFRNSTGVWYTQFSSGGATAAFWGTTGDKPVGRQPGT